MTQRPISGYTRDILNRYFNRLEDVLQADVLTIFGPIYPDLDKAIRSTLEQLQNRWRRIAIVLDTGGGIVEVVERMVNVIRHHYNEVYFIVPNRAMSAGTVFVMAGDKIIMNYFSCLGPIDPQIEKNGKFVPAMSYLNQYQRLYEKAESGQLNTAELILLNNFDAGELYQFEQARLLSQDLLTGWLSKYKFRTWDVHSSTGNPVTPEERRERADETARVLSDYERWRSHGRTISRDTLASDPIRLKIERVEDIPGLSFTVDDYFFSLENYIQTEQPDVFVHTRNNPCKLTIRRSRIPIRRR